MLKEERDKVITTDVGGRKSEDGKGEKVRRSEKQKIGRSPVKSSFGGLPMAAFNGASGGAERMKVEGRGTTGDQRTEIGDQWSPVKSASLVFCEEFNWASEGRKTKEDGRGKTKGR